MNKIIIKAENSNITLEGLSFYDNATGNFMFSPNDPEPDRTQRYRHYGVAQQMSDGTFDFVPERKRRAQSTLIRKLPHGRVSETKDGAVQLTLKVFHEEELPVAYTLLKESKEAFVAVRDHQVAKQLPQLKKLNTNAAFLNV